LNKTWETVLGYSTEELIDRKFLDFVHPDDREATISEMTRLRGDQREIFDFTNRYICKDGSYRFIEWRSQPYGNLIYAAARDVTDIRIEEDKLKRNEEKYRLLAENARDLIYRLDVLPERRFSYVSPASTRMTGYTPEDFYADSLLGFKIIHPDDRHVLKARKNDRLAAKKPLISRWIKDYNLD